MANLSLNDKQVAVFDYLFEKWQELAKPANAAYGELQTYMAGVAKDLGISIEDHTFDADTKTFVPVPKATEEKAPLQMVPSDNETAPTEG